MPRNKGSETKGVTTDWNNAAVSDTEMPKRMQKSIVDDTPFPVWYEESWQSGNAKALSGLTTEQAEEAKRLASITANRMGQMWGIKTGIRHHTAPNDDGTWTYTFLAVDRTKAGEEDADAGVDETETE